MDTQKIASKLPKWVLPTARRLYCYYQKYYTIYCSKIEQNNYHPLKTKKRILVYGVAGLGFGGTEKNLQIIAKYLDKDIYDVFFMYGTKARKLGNYNQEAINERLKYVNIGKNITFIPFDYTNLENKHPYIIKNMTPHIKDVIKYHSIDLVITAGAGNSEYPLTDIKLPIIFLNIFGIPNVLENIKYHLCISNTVGNMILDVVKKEKVKIFYVPSEGPLEKSKIDGLELREKLGFQNKDIVFGRIGRADDTIFDPIGILAFEKIVKKYGNIHYLIVSPPPKLIEIVKKNKIPNVHFMDPIYKEDDVWAFHNTIDVLAHFRYDGESCGLNIAESMLCKNPIISHRSKIWNAHLEYLNKENSFIANIDNIDEYANAIEIFAKDNDKELINNMGIESYKTAMELFHINNYMTRFNQLILETV